MNQVLRVLFIYEYAIIRVSFKCVTHTVLYTLFLTLSNSCLYPVQSSFSVKLYLYFYFFLYIYRYIFNNILLHTICVLLWVQKHAQLSLFVIYLYVRGKQRVYKVCVIIIFVFIFNISMILFCLVFCLTLFSFFFFAVFFFFQVNSAAEGSIKSRLMLS